MRTQVLANNKNTCFYVLRPRDERPPATESATREEGERRRKARGGTETDRKKEGGKEREKRTPSKPGTQHKPTCDRQTRAVSLGLGKKAGAQRAALRGVAAIPKAAQKYNVLWEPMSDGRCDHRAAQRRPQQSDAMAGCNRHCVITSVSAPEPIY